MQEILHHGRVVQEYREFKAGITQEELARRIGKSRRTIVTLEQTACISDLKTRRTLAWALQIPSQLLGLPDMALPEVTILTPVEAPTASDGKSLHRMVIETFTDNLRMRLDLYYLGSAIAADSGLNSHIEELKRLVQKSSIKDRQTFLTLLSHNYQLKGMVARDQLDYVVAEECFRQASLLAQEVESAELNALSMARQAVVYVWQKKFDAAARLYETAREITRRSPPALRAFLATGHAEVQGLLSDQRCLHSLTFARDMLGRIDPADDYLLLHHSTRCSERSINDGWSQCHTLIGKPSIAIESYEKSEKLMDLSMTRMRARLYTQYGVTIFNGEKHTLSDEVASEATLLLSPCSQKTYKGALSAPFLHHLLKKPTEMSEASPLFPAISSRCLLSVCFTPFDIVTPMLNPLCHLNRTIGGRRRGTFDHLKEKTLYS